jgi:molybdopterin molybdotransferase
MLLDLLRCWQFEAVDLGHVNDDPAVIRERLNEGAVAADAILTSGGASAGDEDHLSALLNREGRVTNWRIAVKPGRPLALGFWRDVPFFGLPGNPVAAFVCALVFVRPSLVKMAGGAWEEPKRFTAEAAFSKSKKPGRREYLRARQGADGRIEVFGSEGSGRVSGLSWADGLVELEDGAGEVKPGDMVTYLPFSGFGL